MRLATFDISADTGAALEPAGADLAPCEMAPGERLAGLLEASETLLAASGARTAVLEGGGDRALAAALACAKAPIPFAWVRTEGPRAGHLRRLAVRVIEPGDDPAAVVQAWLAEAAL